MKKIVVIGANGFTGRRLLRNFSSQSRYEVYGISLNPDKWPTAGYHFAERDITDHAGIERLLQDIQPDTVINTSALSVPDYCERHQEEAYAVNVSAVQNLAVCCESLNSRLIHLSTDFVFDGTQHQLYAEEDHPNPLNYYGQTKWMGEQAVATHCSNHAIARVAVVFGKALAGQHGNILQLVKSKLERGEVIRVVADQWRTPTWVEDVSTGIEQLACEPQQGIYHIGGGESLSIAEIAFRVADYFRLDASLVLPVTTAEMKEAVLRPRYSGLSIEKARRELNYRPHTLEEAMKELA